MADDPKYPYPNPQPRSAPLYQPSARDQRLPIGREPLPETPELTVEQRVERLEAWVKEKMFGRIEHQRGNPPRAGNPHVDAQGHAINAEGQRLDAKGQLMDDEGYSLNPEGHRVDAEGRLLDDEGNPIVEPKPEPIYSPPNDPRREH